VVATPTETHFEVVQSLLEQNIHVLVEKPAASSFVQCQQLVELARSRNLKLAVGHVERGNPVVSALKEVLSSGIIGQPVHVATSRAGAFPPKVREGNHVILDLAVHDLDVIRMLLGPLSVSHAFAHCTILPGIFDTAEISLTSREGISATVHVNWLTPQKDRKIRVTGTLASCEVDYIEQSCQVFGPDLQRRLQESNLAWHVVSDASCDIATVPVQAVDALSYQLAEFNRYLLGENHGLAVGDELSESVMLVEKAVALIGEPLSGRFFHEKARWQPAYQLTSNSKSNT